jgi:hypothetical protein
VYVTPQQQTDDSDRHHNVNKFTHQVTPAVRHLIIGGKRVYFVRDEALGGIIMPVNGRVDINITYKPNLILGRGQGEVNSQFATKPHAPLSD